jgi:predicted RNA-binding Zn ribbon-like protein
LRRLAALCTEDTRRAAASALDDVEIAVSEINAAVVASPPAARLALAEGRLYRDTALVGPPVTAALSAVATDAIELFTGGSDSPLRACQAPRCVLYFVKNHPRREWCSSACGNRARAARYYTRHRLNHRAGTGA